MTELEFDKWLETQPIEDKLVSMRYKYSHERKWTQSNEVLEVDMSVDGNYVWLNDWDEGQEDVEILGCIPISDIDVPKFERKDEPQTVEDCRTCKYEDKCEWSSYGYKNYEWCCHGYELKTEPQTDCAWK